MSDFTANARDAFSSRARFTAVPIFLTDEAGNILTDESGAGILTEAGWTGAPKKSSSRASFNSPARELTATPLLLTDTAGEPIFDTSGELVLLTGGYANSTHATSKTRASFTAETRP